MYWFPDDLKTEMDRQTKVPPRSASTGFTLFELAVVLLVVTLLLGSILVPLSAQVQQRNIAQTQRILEETRDSLIGYAMIHGRLPRPANSATDGAERDVACARDADCTGFVPWAALGTSQVDAWGKILRYSVTPAFTVKGAFSLDTQGDKTVRTRDGSGAPTWLVRSLPVPAVIFSQGVNNFGMTQDGVVLRNGSTANFDEIDNEYNDGSRPFWARPTASNPGGPGGDFDDQLVWVPTGLLFARMVQAGQLP